MRITTHTSTAEAVLEEPGAGQTQWSKAVSKRLRRSYARQPVTSQTLGRASISPEWIYRNSGYWLSSFRGASRASNYPAGRGLIAGVNPSTSAFEARAKPILSGRRGGCSSVEDVYSLFHSSALVARFVGEYLPEIRIAAFRSSIVWRVTHPLAHQTAAGDRKWSPCFNI
jgi:hypothetical protein